MGFDIPHLRLPISFEAGSVVEQDSEQEILQNVRVILMYERGQRVDLPRFGVSDQALRQGGADLDEIIKAIADWEPRAVPILERNPGVLQTMIDEITINVSEAGNG
jgi:phage baseplate assembly protein W